MKHYFIAILLVLTACATHHKVAYQTIQSGNEKY